VTSSGGQPGSETLRELTRSRSIVLLTATETEAEPLHAALSNVDRVEIATKSVYLAELNTAGQGQGRGYQHDRGETVGAAIPLVLAVSGCDKANAAHMLTCLLEAMQPPLKLVLQVGIAGGLPSKSGDKGTQAARNGPAIGDIVVATKETYSDTGSSSPEGWLSAAELGLPVARVNGVETGGIFTLDRGLVEGARAAIEAMEWAGSGLRVHVGPCVTSSQATGLQSEIERLEHWEALAESMEGAAGAHVCALYGVPFLEIRGISNLVGDRDKRSWQIQGAATVAARAALAVTAALAAP
jgi:futalosine hydrolase